MIYPYNGFNIWFHFDNITQSPGHQQIMPSMHLVQSSAPSQSSAPLPTQTSANAPPLHSYRSSSFNNGHSAPIRIIPLSPYSHIVNSSMGYTTIHHTHNRSISQPQLSDLSSPDTPRGPSTFIQHEVTRQSDCNTQVQNAVPPSENQLLRNAIKDLTMVLKGNHTGQRQLMADRRKYLSMMVQSLTEVVQDITSPSKFKGDGEIKNVD